MKRGRREPFVLFVVCLVVAMPFAWGEEALPTFDLAKPPNPEVTLCHIPPGDPANAHTIVVGESWGAFAVRAHLAHGDYLGECHSECAGVPAAVPKTGQTWCSGPYGDNVSCDGTGQDGELQKGSSADPRFTDNGDGSVKDNLTGLIWLKDAGCFGDIDWVGALVAANTLASGACGLTDGSVARDWRLPNIKELQSLIDFGQPYPSLPAGHPFSGVQSSYYWSSTSFGCIGCPIPVGVGTAWYVYFGGGHVGHFNKLSWIYVWPVRGGQ